MSSTDSSQLLINFFRSAVSSSPNVSNQSLNVDSQKDTTNKSPSLSSLSSKTHSIPPSFFLSSTDSSSFPINKVTVEEDKKKSSPSLPQLVSSSLPPSSFSDILFNFHSDNNILGGSSTSTHSSVSSFSSPEERKNSLDGSEEIFSSVVNNLQEEPLKTVINAYKPSLEIKKKDFVSFVPSTAAKDEFSDSTREKESPTSMENSLMLNKNNSLPNVSNSSLENTQAISGSNKSEKLVQPTVYRSLEKKSATTNQSEPTLTMKEMHKLENRLHEKLQFIIQKSFKDQMNKWKSDLDIREKNEKLRQEKLLKIVSETLNTNVSVLIETTVKKELQQSLANSVNSLMQSFLNQQLPDLINANIQKNFPPIFDKTVTNALNSAYIDKLDERLSSKFTASMKEIIKTKVENVIFPSLLSSLEQFFKQSLKAQESGLKNLFSKVDLVLNQVTEFRQQTFDLCKEQNIMTQSPNSLTEKLMNEILQKLDDITVSDLEKTDSTSNKLGISDQVILSQIRECIEKKDFSKALLKSFCLRNADNFVNVLKELPTTLDELSLTIPRLFKFIQFIDKYLVSHYEFLFPWIEEALISLDLRLSQSQTKFSSSQREILKSLDINVATYYKLLCGTFSERAVRVPVRLLSSLLGDV